MHKMLIKLNEDKIIKAGLNPKDFLTEIDNIFEKTGGHFSKEILEDGSIVYSGNPTYPNYVGYFGVAYTKLCSNKCFLICAEKWIWLDDDYAPGIYNEEDCLEDAIKDYINEHKG